MIEKQNRLIRNIVATNISKSISTFKYAYVSGGYYRDKTVPKGRPAKCLHGSEVLSELALHISANLLDCFPDSKDHSTVE